MRELLSCEFNMDTACMELRFADGSMISSDYISVENEVAKNMYQQLELDWFAYKAPMDYPKMVLDGEIEDYLWWLVGPYNGIEGHS